MKKLLFLITLLLLPLAASATVEIGGIYYNLVKKTQAEVTSNPKQYSGAVVIPATVDYDGVTYDVTSIGEEAFYRCSGMTSVTIPNSVTFIGEYAFRDCSGLTSINIPNTITSIEEYAFYGCSGLTSVTIPNSVKTIGVDAFEFCSGLTSVTIPNSVTSIGVNAFYATPWYDNWYNSQPDGLLYRNNILWGYKGDNIGDIDIDGTTRVIVDGAFYGCKSLTSVTIPNGVTSIGEETFSGCSNLTSVTIPNSVTTIGEEAFRECSSLTSVTIPNNVASIEKRTFYKCSGLTSVTIGSGVKSIGNHAFEGCSGLTSVTIPTSITFIGSSAFEDCRNLTSVTIPNNVTNIGENAFNGTPWYDNWYKSQPDGLLYRNYVLWGYKGDMPTGDIVIDVTTRFIVDGAFRDCSGLTSVTLPNSLKSIGDDVFQSCTGLTSITIPSSVTSIGESAFMGCTGLTSLTIPNSVTTIGHEAFEDCSGLTSVIIGNGVTFIGGESFKDCDNLTTVVIGNGVTTIVGQAFGNCQKLTSVYCYAANVPTTEISTFRKTNIENATLYVPAASINDYNAVEPWKYFKSIIGLDGTMPDVPEVPKCATPTIAYQNGKLTFECETEGAICRYTITDSDIKSDSGNEVDLTVTYNISVYATKAGYDNSDVVTAMLCWIDVTPTGENVVVGKSEVRAMPVLIESDGGVLTVKGVAEGTPISVYDTAGRKVGSATATTNATRISTTLRNGDIGIIRIGERAIKMAIK